MLQVTYIDIDSTFILYESFLKQNLFTALTIKILVIIETKYKLKRSG